MIHPFLLANIVAVFKQEVIGTSIHVIMIP